MATQSESIQQHFSVGTYINRGLTVISGNGVNLYDEKGDPYLDLMSNYGVNILGHAHPHVTSSLISQLKSLTTLHGSFNNDTRATAVKMLINRCGGNLQQVYLSNSGSESTEAALKFAVLATKKKHFIVAHHGYHGKTLGALSATDGHKYKEHFLPLLWDFTSVPFGECSKIKDAIRPDTCAVILEPIQGEGGIYVPSQSYLQEVRAICDKARVVLILDEIQTGCGRTGTFLASHTARISYDIVCLGKGLAGGIPVGATLVSKRIAEAIPKHIHTSTFGANPLACAGIIATLETLDEKLLDHTREVGTYFLSQLRNIQSPFIVEVRGLGLMIGIEVTEKRDEILKKLQQEKILAIPASERIIRFLPPLIITKTHIDHTVQVLSRIFENL